MLAQTASSSGTIMRLCWACSVIEFELNCVGSTTAPSLALVRRSVTGDTKRCAHLRACSRRAEEACDELVVKDILRVVTRRPRAGMSL